MSFDSANCLDNVIGLSETPCVCFDVPETATESKSGLFLDKLEGLNLKMIDAGTDCSEGNIWDFMNNARNSAILQFRTYLLAGLTKEYKQKIRPFSGAIGETKFRKTLAPQGTSAGLSLYTNSIRGGYMKVKRIGTVFASTNAAFDIHLYNDLEDGSLETISVASEANKLKWNTLSTPLYLPMATETGEYIRYDFLYSTSDAPDPKDAKLWCGCGGNRNYYDSKAPRFKAFNSSSAHWMNFVMAAGASGNAISNPTERDNMTRNTIVMNGLIMDVEFVCELEDLICQHVEDFDNGNLSLAIATCIRYMAGVFLMDYILSSGNINVYTMSDRERMMGKKNTYVKEYNNLLNEMIIPQMNIDGNDCLICDNTRGPFKRGILA